MNKEPSKHVRAEPPAMGERRARWGYGYQDKVATERILNVLRRDLRDGDGAFQGIRLADLDAGRVDDFVLLWADFVEGNSIKWSREAASFTWGELIGAAGLLRELASGWTRLRTRWAGRSVTVRIQTNRPASIERHHAQLITTVSLATFVESHWPAGPDAAASQDERDAWSVIAEHVGLADAELSDFVAHCELAFGRPEPPGSEPDSQDSRHYRKQFDLLHKAIATWLTNNLDGELIEREYLLAAIGLRTKRSGLIQRFPEPDIPYEKNNVCAGDLQATLDALPGGYVAVVGPAGVGKSTLVQDVLTDSSNALFIPYYAFLPSTDGNRDRAEALTFFQDVVDRLDGFELTRRSLGVADIAQGREALRQHMASAKQRYLLSGHKTVLLVDGLDHVVREVNLRSSVLSELPPPSEVPEGFLIVLSGQPQAFLAGVIPPAIAAAVEQGARRIEVSGLSRKETHLLVSRLSRSTTGEERDAIYGATLGNPLILTYLISYLERTPDTDVGQAIALTGKYAGQIDQYYRDRLSVPLTDGATRTLLGLLCRAAPTLPTEWLAEWPERATLEDVYERVLTPFVRFNGGQLTFIHDSLISFLKKETRSRLPGIAPASEERRFHSILADRSQDRPCLDPVGRARVVHLSRSGRHADLLAQLSSPWLRSSVNGFLPYDHVHPLLLEGYAAAMAVGAWGHVLRLLLLGFELDQRTSRLDAGRLAEALLALGDPALALSQVRFGGRLLVDDSAALRFASSLWWYAHRQERSDLKAEARTLYVQAKPISHIHTGERLDTATHHEHIDRLSAWSETAPLFESPETVAKDIDRLVLTARDGHHGPDPIASKGGLLFNALSVALDADCDAPTCRVLVDALQALSDQWRFVALLRFAEARPSEVPIEALRAAYSTGEANKDIGLAYAWFLSRNGDHATAAEIVSSLPHIRFEPHTDRHSWGFSDVTYTIRLRWLQEAYGVPEGTVPGATAEREEAYARAEHTSRRIGQLRATAASGAVAGDRHSIFRALLLFHNRPVHFATLSPHSDFVLHRSRSSIYEQVGQLARAMGASGLRALRDVVLDLTAGPGSDQFTPPQRREFARLFFHEGLMSREEAGLLGLSSTADAADDDPAQRQEGCLEIAAFLYCIGDDSGAERWTTRATEVSAGAGSHKDYHMSHVGDWLTRSISQPEPPQLVVLDQFARALEVSGGRGGSDGAKTLLHILLRTNPARASSLAVEFLDRSVLNAPDVLEAFIAGGADAQAHPELLCAIYGELQSLLAPNDTSYTAAAVLNAFPREAQESAATRLMSFVCTNVLPSHRAPVARALQDALMAHGVEPDSLTLGLEPGHDDSSRRSALYWLVNGEVQTLHQVARRLSDWSRPDSWNPNPEANKEFDWWAAIKAATLRDEQHFDCLVARFPPPDYRQVELLVQKAQVLLKSGSPSSAREVIEQAIMQSRDGSWIYWRDGGQKLIVFRALALIDREEGVRRAREQFSKDLSAGKLSATSMLAAIGEILDLLECEWPSDAALAAVGDYLEQVLSASPPEQPYTSLAGAVSSWSVDQSLCRLVAELLAFPVVDVAVAARRALAEYLTRDGRGFIALLTGPPWWNPIQLEHVLAVVHVGSASPNIGLLKAWIESLNRSESLAARSIAKRIANGQGWDWRDITTEPALPVILLPSGYTSRSDAGMLLGGDVAIAWDLYQLLTDHLERRGADQHEMRSEFEHIYHALEKEYPWADDDRLKRWMKSFLARAWLKPRAIIGREAAMRVFGRRSLSGQVSPGAEDAYDRFYPIYDVSLELTKPRRRPQELRALDWRFSRDEGDQWLKGVGADKWNSYPDSIDGFTVIGERTWLIRPEWEWPREERYRSAIMGTVPDDPERHRVRSAGELTYEMYREGRAQENHQLVVLNSERQLIGPAYRWAAINAGFARALGWRLSDDVPFQWLDSKGDVMVQSTYWRDGWIWLEPPRFESLGEGWYVSVAPDGLAAIRRLAPNANVHLWVERHSHGERPYEGKWHLSRPL